MNIRTGFKGILFLCIVFGACRKGDDAPADVCCSTVYTSIMDNPYDITGIEGVFSANVVIDSADSDHPVRVFYTASVPTFEDTASVYANSWGLEKNGLILSTPFKNLTFDTSLSEFNVSWIVKRNGGNNFTYTNIDSFPTCASILPDTITNGINNTFYFDGSILKNADTVLIKIFSPTSSDSINYLKYYADAEVADKIEIPSDVFQSLVSKRIRMAISVFNHRAYSVNGKKYLFLQQHTETGYVWFR